MTRWREVKKMVREATHRLREGRGLVWGLIALLTSGLRANPGVPPWKGQVVSASGQPVADAQVWVYTQGPVGEEARAVSVKTDSKGRFAIPAAALPEAPAEARVLIAVAAGQALTWQLQTEASDLSQLRLVLNPEAPFSGRVRDASQRPLGNVTVRAAYLVFPGQGQAPRRFLALDPALNLLTTQTRADGTFTLSGVPLGAEVGLELIYPDYAWKLLAVSAVEAADLDLTLSPRGHLSGRVTVAETGQPVPGLLICCESDPPADIRAQALTDAGGRFRITHLEEGTYQVWVQFPESLPEWAAVGRANVRVVAGKTTDGIDLELVRGEVLTGRVIDEESGAPVAGARLEVTHLQTGVSHSVATDEGGTFRLRLEPGTVQVVLQSLPQGFVGDPQKNVRRVPVEMGENPPEVLFAVRQGLMVVGRVMDREGQPVANAVITAAGDGSGHAVSDAQGRFALAGLKPGRGLILQATQPTLGLAGCVPIRTALDMGEVTLTLEESPIVQGRVVNEARQPLADATLTVFVIQESQGQQVFSPLTPRVQSNRFGRYEVTGLLPGVPFFLQAEAEGYSQARTEVLTAAGGEVKKLGDLTLPRANSFLAGKVTDVEGNPIPGVEIQAYGGVSQPLPGVEVRVVGGFPRKAVTDAQGRYCLDHLVKGVVYVNLQHPDYYPDFQGAAQTGTEEADFVLMRKTVAPQKTIQWGMPAPELQVSRWINGDVKSLADLRGRVVLLAFCPFYIPPCRELLPQLQALHQQYHAAGLTVLQIVDHSIPPEELEPLAREMGIPYPLGWVEPSRDLGWSSPAFGHYGVQTVPAFFLIDKQGVLRHEGDGSRLEKRIQDLLLE